jgi:Ca2+-binding EF-hand superfamily protein
LLFARYDEDRDGLINYRDFCNMVMPNNPSAASRLLNRITSRDFLLRAHLNVEQAHEYIRERFSKKADTEGWRLEEMFEAVDTQGSNRLSIYDVEKLIINYKKSGSRTLIEDVELLFAMYDKQKVGRINFFDFKD